MTRIEIICPDGVGKGTRVLVDGKDIFNIQHLKLEIPASGAAEMIVKKLVWEGEDPIAPSDKLHLLPIETLKFVGFPSSCTVVDDN